VSEAINELIRIGLTTKKRPKRFGQRTSAMNISVDVTSIGEALGALEGLTAR
jgi:hypothetical protein